MKKNIQAIRGMNDYLPYDTAILQHIEDSLKQVLLRYGYREIRFPILEKTSLFKRAIGTFTDVVEKEMYTFEDRNGDSLTMRPEGTASCARACIEHGLLYNQEQRLWYIGPMFRHERPQRGRYRQFSQLGVEAFGSREPSIDAELIMITARWWKILGITKYVSLELNSIGSSKTRSRYCAALIDFLEKNKDKLKEDYRCKIYSNPFCILDSKNPDVQNLLNNAPILGDYLDNDSREHFIGLCKLLDNVGISYTINQHLIRGLDYYNFTVFEWVTTNLGTQRTICAGGRYDGLVEQLGGRSTPAVGFATGIERIFLLVQQTIKPIQIDTFIDIYLITSKTIGAQSAGIKLAERIRDAFPNVKLMTNHSSSSFKKQFAYADKYGAKIALVLGESEIAINAVVTKDLRSGKQMTITQDNVITYLQTFIFLNKEKVQYESTQ